MAMMSACKLLNGFAKLSIRPSTFQLNRTPLVFNQTTRMICLSSCLSRRLDNHAHPPFKLPSERNNRWVEMKKISEMYEYTTEPIKIPRYGGRGPNGRIWNHKRGGGRPKVFHMMDWIRGKNLEDQQQLEKVIKIQPDQNRTGHIALVASGEHKRFILATENMKPGDVIMTSQTVTRSAVRPNEGDAHPLGSLPVGTLVNCVERYPGKGAVMVRAAGTSALLIRKQDGMCVIRLPSKQEVSVSENCLATVGRISNVLHNKQKLGKAGASRWLGIRPRSGRWHRKTGRSGRKIKPLPPVLVYKDCKPARRKELRFTLPNPPGIYESRRF